MMKIYRGICRGGPNDGRQLEWEANEYSMVVRPPSQLPVTEVDLRLVDELKWGTYRYVGGCWVWHFDG
jgi:hypothetical protein